MKERTTAETMGTVRFFLAQPALAGAVFCVMMVLFCLAESRSLFLAGFFAIAGLVLLVGGASVWMMWGHWKRWLLTTYLLYAVVAVVVRHTVY